jgi:hypothetical protein
MADRFDLDAIDADDVLLDLLAAGGESARTAAEHDPAVKLLADLRLAVEVEDELPVETIDDPESFLARCAALNPVTDPFARKVAARGVALGVAAVAALSVSGVAAAVTGDPLSPYEKVIEKMVDAVRPQTSFPTEQLDGMPVVDKTKIVKVAKDFQRKQEEKQAAEQEKAEKGEPTPPASVEHALPEVLQRVLPKVDQQTVKPVEPTVAEPTKVPEDTDESKTEEKPVEDQPTSDPTEQPTSDPTEQPTSDPTPTPTPTPDPTDPPTTTPPPVEPTEPAKTPPPTNDETGETGNGDTGNGQAGNPTGDPTTTPSTQPGGDQGSNTGESGDDSSTGEQLPADDATPPAGDTKPVDDATLPGGDTKPGDAELEQPPVAETPGDEVRDLVEEVEQLVNPMLATTAGAPSAQTFVDSGAKHSSGKVTTGSVHATYAKGKHSSGMYAEGKHAAIARTHGSLEDKAVLRILGVVNPSQK